MARAVVVALLCAICLASVTATNLRMLKKQVSSQLPAASQAIVASQAPGPVATQSGAIVTSQSLNAVSSQVLASSHEGSVALGESGAVASSGEHTLSAEHSSESGTLSSEGSSSHSTGSSSESSHTCADPKTCSYPVKLIEKIDEDLKAVVPPPDKKAKEADNPSKQGVLKPAPTFVEIEATAVVAVEHPTTLAERDKEVKRLVPDENTFTLKTDATGQDYDISFDKQMGLAPTMSVSTILIKRAEKMLPIADKRHYEFEEHHELNCAGSICPKEVPT